MNQTVLTAMQRKALKARAHHLKPVVMTGAAGLTDAVLAEIELALERHELIKVRLAGTDRDGHRRANEEICRRTQAALVQSIGHVSVLYRESRDD